MKAGKLATTFALSLTVALGRAGSTLAQQLERLQSTKLAYAACMQASARRLYRGEDTPQLEANVAESCNSELDDWVNAMGAGVPPAVAAAARRAVDVSFFSHMAVAYAAACNRSPKQCPE